jgi:proline iminopeptidase
MSNQPARHDDSQWMGNQEMQPLLWQQRSLKTDDLDLAWYEAGDGPPVVILHGGPGHDHRLMRPFAAPLTRQFRCILPDQRGSGHSLLPQFDAHSLHIDRFVEDIDALRRDLNLAQLSLVGWSWGAALAFFYSLAHPHQVARLAMISPGPIPFEFLEVYQANLLRPLTSAERAEVAEIQAQSAAAFQAGDVAQYQALFQRRIEIIFRVWFYDPALAEGQREGFLQAFDAYHIAQMEPYIYGSLGEFQGWGNLQELKMPTLIVYGYQDFEPITQAYTLRDWLPQAQLGWINQCGHWPWIEQPARFYPLLESFLGSEAG